MLGDVETVIGTLSSSRATLLDICHP